VARQEPAHHTDFIPLQPWFGPGAVGKEILERVRVGTSLAQRVKRQVIRALRPTIENAAVPFLLAGFRFVTAVERVRMARWSLLLNGWVGETQVDVDSAVAESHYKNLSTDPVGKKAE